MNKTSPAEPSGSPVRFGDGWAGGSAARLRGIIALSLSHAAAILGCWLAADRDRPGPAATGGEVTGNPPDTWAPRTAPVDRAGAQTSPARPEDGGPPKTSGTRGRTDPGWRAGLAHARSVQAVVRFPGVELAAALRLAAGRGAEVRLVCERRPTPLPPGAEPTAPPENTRAQRGLEPAVYVVRPGTIQAEGLFVDGFRWLGLELPGERETGPEHRSTPPLH